MERHQFVFALLDAADRVRHRLERGLSNIKGISFTEFQLLSALERFPGAAATRVDLAAEVGLTPSGVTRALKPLEKQGMVTTVKAARDARRALATLTEEGLELVADARGVVDDVLDDMDVIDTLRPVDRERFLRLLTELRHG